jgi:hypothetical protein
LVGKIILKSKIFKIGGIKLKFSKGFIVLFVLLAMATVSFAAPVKDVKSTELQDLFAQLDATPMSNAELDKVQGEVAWYVAYYGWMAVNYGLNFVAKNINKYGATAVIQVSEYYRGYKLGQYAASSNRNYNVSREMTAFQIGYKHGR